MFGLIRSKYAARIATKYFCVVSYQENCENEQIHYNSTYSHSFRAEK